MPTSLSLGACPGNLRRLRHLRPSRAAAIVLLVMTLPSCEAVYGPTSPSAEWAVHESPRFAMYTRAGSFCEANVVALADALEVQYAHAVRALDIDMGGRISMFLYNSGSEMHPPLSSPRSGVAFPETNAVHLTCMPPFDAGLRALAAHEANHVIVQNGLGRAGTSFMNEGLATALVSPSFGNVGPVWAHSWVRGNRSRVVRVGMFIDDAKWDGMQDSYDSSASFLAYLLDHYGPARLKQIYYTRSADMAQRMAEVYGKPLEALEAEWLGAI